MANQSLRRVRLLAIELLVSHCEAHVDISESMDALSAALQQLAEDALAAVHLPSTPAVPAWRDGDGLSVARSRSRSPPPGRASVPAPHAHDVVVVDLTDVIASASPVPPPVPTFPFGPFLALELPGCPLGCSHWVSPLFRAVHQFRRAHAYCRIVNTEHMCVGTGAEFPGMEVTPLKC